MQQKGYHGDHYCIRYVIVNSEFENILLYCSLIFTILHFGLLSEINSESVTCMLKKYNNFIVNDEKHMCEFNDHTNLKLLHCYEILPDLKMSDFTTLELHYIFFLRLVV